MDARDPTAGDLPNELGTSVAITPHPARGASGPGSVRSTELGAGEVVTGRTGEAQPFQPSVVRGSGWRPVEPWRSDPGRRCTLDSPCPTA